MEELIGGSEHTTKQPIQKDHRESVCVLKEAGSGEIQGEGSIAMRLMLTNSRYETDLPFNVRPIRIGSTGTGIPCDRLSQAPDVARWFILVQTSQ